MSNVIALPATNALRPIVGTATYTVLEVARLLNLSRGVTYQLVQDGSIPAKRVGRRWLIPKERFHEWLNTVEETAGEAI